MSSCWSVCLSSWQRCVHVCICVFLMFHVSISRALKRLWGLVLCVTMNATCNILTSASPMLVCASVCACVCVFLSPAQSHLQPINCWLHAAHLLPCCLYLLVALLCISWQWVDLFSFLPNVLLKIYWNSSFLWYTDVFGV